MNNLIHLNPIDPILEEFEGFVDKDAGLKTIAFKYFGADINQALEYLKISLSGLQKNDDNLSIISMITSDNYYQPELMLI